jgi:hypothetical protein
MTKSIMYEDILYNTFNKTKLILYIFICFSIKLAHIKKILEQTYNYNYFERQIANPFTDNFTSSCNFGSNRILRSGVKNGSCIF